MSAFAEKLPENNDEFSPQAVVETEYRRKHRLLSQSSQPYERLSWLVYQRITSRQWFEAFVMINILVVGLATGLDLEFSASEIVGKFVNFVSNFTMIVFTCEVILKIIAEGFEPLRYFYHPENGHFNTFDFIIVVLGYALASIGGGAVSALRMVST